jgi:predicted DNA-binding transcriptional regulator YafY
MNPFEKIFNYQVISRLDESGTIAITAHERTWLKTMLAHPAAAQAFTKETLEKLHQILEPEDAYDVSGGLTEKAKSLEKQVYHPLLRVIRDILLNQQGIKITYQNKNGKTYLDQPGIPYKLEYSMVKREWYLLWYHLRFEMYMSTRLHHVLKVEEAPMSEQIVTDVISTIEQTLDSRKEEAVIEVVRTYNEELTRILYAFSCFEKEVEYLDNVDTYRIKLTFLVDDREYILSKIRFLGLRIRVVQGEALQRRMYESSQKALIRYGVE